MNAETELQNLAQGFRLLSDSSRLGILRALAKGPKNVSALCKALGLNQPTASHHLGLLRMGRLVKGTRQGRSILYEIDRPNMKVLGSALSKLGGS